MFSVTLSNAALKAVRGLDAKMRERVHEVIGVLSVEPVPAKHFDVIKLAGMDGYYRIRLSSYRLTYFVDWDLKRIKVLDFERRDEHTYR